GCARPRGGGTAREDKDLAERTAGHRQGGPRLSGLEPRGRDRREPPRRLQLRAPILGHDSLRGAPEGPGALTRTTSHLGAGTSAPRSAKTSVPLKAGSD